MNAVEVRNKHETAVFELFEHTKKEPTPIDEQRLTYLQEKRAMASSIGLSAQTELMDREIAKAHTPIPALDTPAMTQDELVVWRAFLPKAYKFNVFNARVSERFGDRYEYDSIPMPVMQRWQDAIKQGVFTRYEIWTPEKPRLDPILIGFVDNKRYLLARWAESDANFVTFNDVKRKVFMREARPFAAVSVFAAAVALFVMSVIVWGFNDDFVGNLKAFSLPAVGLFAAIFSYACWDDTVLKAVIRHTLSSLKSKR